MYDPAGNVDPERPGLSTLFIRLPAFAVYPESHYACTKNAERGNRRSHRASTVGPAAEGRGPESRSSRAAHRAVRTGRRPGASALP